MLCFRVLSLMPSNERLVFGSVDTWLIVSSTTTVMTGNPPMRSKREVWGGWLAQPCIHAIVINNIEAKNSFDIVLLTNISNPYSITQYHLHDTCYVFNVAKTLHFYSSNKCS